VAPAFLLVFPWAYRAAPCNAQTAAGGQNVSADAGAALAQLAHGNLAAAAKRTRLALQAAPGDATLHILAGAILLNGNDPAGARVAFENARTCDGTDSLALYGLGLAQLGLGDRAAAARAFARAGEAGGDPTYLMLARRYQQWLDGTQITPESVGLPDAMAPAQSALQGMAALRRGDTARAIAQLEAASTALPGDGILEPGGLLMTFEPAHPLIAMGRVPANSGLAESLPADRGLHGVVQLVPQGVDDGIAYVSYDLDGRSLNLVNARPFDYDWDTSHTENGWHEVRITLYNAQAQEVSRVTHRVRVANAKPAPDSGPRREAWERLRAALWQALTLQPARYPCANGLGQLYRAQGDPAKARAWFARAAAAQPNGEVRHELALCGGIADGGVALWGGRSDEKVVALTFDDGPKPGITEPLLDILTRAQVPATFFVIGKHVMEYPELTRQLAAAGMEIANHSYTHRNLTHLPLEEVAREVMQTQAAVYSVVGKTPRFLRPPGGNWNGTVAGIVRQWGLTPCMWTVDVYGSEVIGAQQVADAVLQQVQPGSIILMHNGKMNTLQALPTIIRTLRERGYTFATVDALARRLEVAREAARQASRAAAIALPHRTE
jgi:peptidoglycan/xylan/chitin deacetylase (PgdA/CDA1 family)